VSAVSQRLSRASGWGRRIDQGIHGRRAAFNLRHIAPLVPRGARVLDLGAGDGLLAGQLARHNRCQVLGVDVEDRALSDVPLLLYDGARLPLADDAVDVSICVAVLHHCDNLEAVLGELRRVTRGKLLLIEDRFESWLDRLCVIAVHHYLRAVESMPFRRAGFGDVATWRTRLAAAGFRSAEVIPLPGRAVPWIPVRNVLYVAEPA